MKATHARPPLDVAITATVRADILRMTLRSFHKNFLRHFAARAIINVDPVGDTGSHAPSDMVDICREYFTDVVYRTPESPSFAAAVQWCWRQVETEVFLHLEDDWILRRPVAAAEMLRVFDDPNVMGVTLNKWNKKRLCAWIEKELQIHPAEFDDHGNRYLRMPIPALNPGLLRRDYANRCSAHMAIDQDPEGQLGDLWRRLTAGEERPVFLWRFSDEVILIDIGNRWRKARFIHKRWGEGRTTAWGTLGNRTRLRIATRAARWHAAKWYWRARYL